MRRIVAVIVLVLFLTSCSGAPSPSPTPTDTGAKRVLIFGDSYTEGVGAATKTDGYAYRVGPALGWDVTVDGVGGTGYVNPNGTKGTYLERLSLAKYTDQFDLVILEGGTNDQKYPIATVSTAIDDTLDAFSARFPSAKVVMIGMLSWDPSVSTAKSTLNTTLHDAANARGYFFLDPLSESWFTAADKKTLINPANNHPNGGGYAVMATRVVADLEKLPL